MPQRSYRGQPASAFCMDNTNELIEVRAWQRTFDGAYGRAALSNLGYSFTILRLFDRKFYLGLLYALLSVLLFGISFVRSRHAKHSLSDEYLRSGVNSRSSSLDITRSSSLETATEKEQPLVTKGLEGKPSIGPPFRTSGCIVLAVAGVVAAVEIGLLVLVLQL